MGLASPQGADKINHMVAGAPAQPCLGVGGRRRSGQHPLGEPSGAVLGVLGSQSRALTMATGETQGIVKKFRFHSEHLSKTQSRRGSTIL